MSAAESEGAGTSDNPRRRAFNERALLDRAREYHASGGHLDAMVWINTEGGTLRIEPPEPLGPQPNTMLWFAACEGWCTAMNWLIDRGADLHACGHLDHFPLSAAVVNNHRDAAVVLLDAGVRIDDSPRGRTALHTATLHGNYELVRLLLSRGASSWDVRDPVGEVPETYARRYGYTKTLNLLVAVREAGSWRSYVDAPRLELHALRRELSSLRKGGRAPPSATARSTRASTSPSDPVKTPGTPATAAVVLCGCRAA